MTADDPEVTFTERPDILITAECHGLTRSWLRGDDDAAETERQKQVAATELRAILRQRGCKSAAFQLRGNDGV